ncbi:hypothetical protein KC571_02220 [candidate division WWE3 bacterium]|uniref:Uncharacterized protein n=1 Tax=candidate division WWE3 bacterium TaxID=2053526 RepID=A0A955LGX0_UNCKA|nr:hypothetical protein [candidate division WWE3 bacterium]
MQRYHIPIVILGLVSTFVLYLVYTQRSPFVTGDEVEILVLDTTSIVYFLTALFLTSFSWIAISLYFLYRIINRHGLKRVQTRQSLKIGILAAAGITGMAALKITQALNIVTGLLLWATLAAIVWSTRNASNEMINEA